MLLASQGIPRSIGVTIAAVLIGAWVVYILFNIRWSKPETGSEIELAPNRKPYLSDEELEGKKLERTQLLGLAMLVVVGLGLPLYWLNEPSRQAGAIEKFDKRFASWGSQLFATTAEGGFNCAGCHGGMQAGGGEAAYTVTDPNTGQVRPVLWKSPALTTVLYRFSDEEVRYILVYGRPFSPMSPWGLAGGGPMNDQQIDNLIAYLRSIQITPEAAQAEVTKALEEARAANPDATEGELLFNLSAGSGAYSCARCHTRGWSYGDPQVSGGGAFGPNLTAGSTVRQFPSAAAHVEFIGVGSQNGKRYGQQGQGSGRMPGFREILTAEQIQAIVDYERNL